MHRFFRRLQTRRRKKGLRRLVCVAVIFSILFSLFLFTDSRLRPILTDSASNQAKIKVNNVVNDVVYTYLQEENISYSDIIKLNYLADQKISSIETNTINLNKLKAGIMTKIMSKVAEDQNIVVAIPLGTLVGNDYFVGRGLKIKIQLSLSTAVFTDISSDFISAGINQTLHEIFLNVKMKAYIMMPWFRTSTDVVTNFLIAETVIVGAVPDAYTNVIETPADDIAGILFDYTAEAP